MTLVEQRASTGQKVCQPLHTPLWLKFVPFLGGYISCPSHETPPEEKTKERTERSVDGCRMKAEAAERGGRWRNKKCTSVKKSDALNTKLWKT